MALQKINSSWFLSQFEARNIPQKQVAQWFGIHPSAVSLILKGKRKLQLDEAVELAKRTAIPLEEIVANAGIGYPTLSEAKSDTIPVTGWVDGHGKVRSARGKAGNGVSRAPGTAPNPGFGRKKGVEVLRLSTSGSKLDGVDGGLVYYQPLQSVTVDAIGRLCVVKTDGGDTLLAVVKRGYRSGAFNLFSMTGEQLETDVMLESASPVIWMKL